MTVLAAAHTISGRVQIVAVIVTAIMLGVVLELVRRRRLAQEAAGFELLATRQQLLRGL